MNPKEKVEDRRKLMCRYYKKPCEKMWEKCSHALKEERQYPDGTVLVILGCCDWIAAEGLYNMNNQLTKIQAEMGETKNASLYTGMALSVNPNMAMRGVDEIRRMANRVLPVVKDDPNEKKQIQ